MKKYTKPSINVIELQLKENIAAVPTTVYKGSAKATAQASTNAKTFNLNLNTSGDYIFQNS